MHRGVLKCRVRARTADAQTLGCMRHIVLAVLLTSPLVAAATPPPPRPPLFGLAMFGGDSPPCVAISSGSAAVGEYVSVLVLSEPPRAFQARIGATPASPCDDSELTGTTFELVQIQGPLPEDPDIAIVVRETASQLKRIGEEKWAVVGSEPPRTFRRCASSEGLHFSAWVGARRVWHEYYYLGYDVDPTCTEEETAE